MKFCNKCGSPVLEGKNFCVKCGAQVNSKASRNNGPAPRPRPNDGRSEQMPGPEMGQDPESMVGASKKKSKKPIIISCSIILVVVILITTYLIIAFNAQSSVKSKCSELENYLKQGVVLTPTNASLYNDAKDDESSLNAFALYKDKSNMEDLIKMAGVYVAANKTYNDCETNTDKLVDGLETAGIDVNTLNDYKPLLDSQQKLKAAMDNNNADQMVKEQENVYNNFKDFEKEVGTEEAKKAKSKGEAESALSGWKGELKGYDENAVNNGVDEDLVVETTRSSVVSLMDDYQGYLDDNDLNSANKLAETIIEELTTYRNEINNAIKEKKEEEEERDDFSDDVEAKDNYYALETIDTEPISGNPFDGYGLTEKQKFCLLVIAKNEVFAKRGYVFGKTVSNYFKNREWYEPDKSVRDDKIFSDLKKANNTEYKNLKKIQKLIDKYAKKYDWAGKTVKKSKITTSDLEDAIQALHS